MNSPGSSNGKQGQSRNVLYLLGSAVVLTLIGFFAFMPKFGADNSASTLRWLYEAWNAENKYYEHGWIVVAVMVYFIWKAWKPMKEEPARGSNAGLLWIALGLFLWLGAFRAIQARVAVVSLPCLVLGGVHFVWGWKVARHLMFPLSLFAFMVPMPGLEQMTNGLAIFATKMAHKVGLLIGMETIQSGTQLFEPKAAGAGPDSQAGSFRVNEGCSGLRSLVALLLISYTYGMVVHRKWWERFVIFATAVPIAMVANGVRITSILAVALIDRTFAIETWHNYSGFFSFAAALGLLMLLSFIMRRGIRALKPKVKITRVGESAPVGNASMP